MFKCLNLIKGPWLAMTDRRARPARWQTHTGSHAGRSWARGRAREDRESDWNDCKQFPDVWLEGVCVRCHRGKWIMGTNSLSCVRVFPRSGWWYPRHISAGLHTCVFGAEMVWKESLALVNHAGCCCSAARLENNCDGLSESINVIHHLTLSLTLSLI